METFSTSQIASLTGIHVNTVRFYERIGLIAPVPRLENNYRQFSLHHLYQIQILRHIYLDEWPGKIIRNASLKIIEAMKNWDLNMALGYSHDFLDIASKEYERAQENAELLRNIQADDFRYASDIAYDLKGAAAKLGVTCETVRNWERNALISVPRRENSRSRVFSSQEMIRLEVIYMLRQGGYSIAAIHNALMVLTELDSDDAVAELKRPERLEIYSTGDHVVEVLELTLRHGKEIVQLIKKAIKLNL